MEKETFGDSEKAGNHFVGGGFGGLDHKYKYLIYCCLKKIKIMLAC